MATFAIYKNRKEENMKNREKSEIVIPKGYTIEEMMEPVGDFWDEEPSGQEEVKVRFE